SSVAPSEMLASTVSPAPLVAVLVEVDVAALVLVLVAVLDPVPVVAVLVASDPPGRVDVAVVVPSVPRSVPPLSPSSEQPAISATPTTPTPRAKAMRFMCSPLSADPATPDSALGG